MTEITDEQFHFLAHHDIPMSAVFDAAGMGRAEYQEMMRELGKMVAVGVTPCRENGHTLRLRSGQCAICRPAGIAFLRRHQTDGCVYIASSRQIGLIKIGFEEFGGDRETSLNRDGYGGATDWRILYRRSFKNAGKVEIEAHRLLGDARARRRYLRLQHGTEVDCYELFDCHYARAKNALEALSASAIGPAWEVEALPPSGGQTTPSSVVVPPQEWWRLLLKRFFR